MISPVKKLKDSVPLCMLSSQDIFDRRSGLIHFFGNREYRVDEVSYLLAEHHDQDKKRYERQN